MLVAISIPCKTDSKNDQNSICTCAYTRKIYLMFERRRTMTDVTIYDISWWCAASFKHTILNSIR